MRLRAARARAGARARLIAGRRQLGSGGSRAVATPPPSRCWKSTLSLSAMRARQDAELAARLGKKMTAPKSFPRVALDLATTVERIQQNFCICDPNLPDCPIVFASDGFLEMSEYDRFEVLGRNCRFLQARARTARRRAASPEVQSA